MEVSLRTASVLCSTALLISLACFLAGCSLDPNVRKERYFLSGQRYFDEGKYSEAAIEYVNALKIDGNYADAHYQLAKACLKQQQWPRAFDELKRTVDLQPDNYSARFDLAKLLIASGSMQQAKEQTDLLLAKRPNDPKSHLIVASLLAAQANYPAGIEEMQKTIAFDSGDWDSYLNLALMEMKDNQLDLAEAHFKKAIDLNPKATDARLMLGHFYQSRNRFGEAEQQFRGGIGIDPQNPDLRASLARLYLDQGKKAEAEEFLKQVKRELANNSIGYRMLGDFYFAAGELDKAAAEYKSLWEEHPKDLEVKKNYIQLLILTNQLNDASRLNDEILRSNPNDDKSLLYAGQIQTRNGRPNDAVATLQRLTKNDPSSGAGHYQLALAFQELGDQESAERELRDAVRLSPDMSEARRSLALLAMRKGDMTTLESAATGLINLRPALAEGYALRAVSEINRNQLASAEADCRKAIEVGPQSQLGYVQMGNLRFVQKRYTDAATAYQQALDRDANSTDALRGLINTRLAQRQTNAAVAVVKAQIAKSPTNGDFYDLLGTLLFRNGIDLNAAEEALKKSTDLNRKNLDALIKLGQVQSAKGNVDQAIATYNQAIQDNPRDASFYVLAGELYQRKLDWTNAEDSYQKALGLRPQHPQAAGNLALVMLELNQNLDVALSLAQTARRGLPQSASVVDTLGWIYYRKGVYPSAIDCFQEALKLQRESRSPDDPRVHYHLGLAYTKSGQSALARQELQRMLKMNPNSSDAAEAKKQLAQLKS
jgi:tetratricopeptide (TPR) repeat protein